MYICPQEVATKLLTSKTENMTIQEKLNRKGYNLVASYNNGERVGYFATSRNYNKRTRTYRTQTEVLKALR